MRKSYLYVVMGIIFLSGCGQNTNETTMSPSEQLAAGKEIVISLNAQTPSTTDATVTAVAPEAVAQMPAETENPTNQQIQQALKNAGLYDGAIDGSIGKKSKNAIITFQEQNGLEPDGKVGKKTWAKLAPFLSAAAASTVSSEPSN